MQNTSTSPATLRRLARQTAIQIMYGWEQPKLTLAIDATERTLQHAGSFGIPRDQEGFVLQLVRGVERHLSEIDALLQSSLQGWNLQRLGAVERNILRLAAYELLHETETPPAVVINEALELAKLFCEPESLPLIHGLLDAGIVRRQNPPLAPESISTVESELHVAGGSSTL